MLNYGYMVIWGWVKTYYYILLPYLGEWNMNKPTFLGDYGQGFDS